MPSIQISLSNEAYLKLIKESEKEEKNRSKIINDLILKYIEAEDTRERAKEWIKNNIIENTGSTLKKEEIYNRYREETGDIRKLEFYKALETFHFKDIRINNIRYLENISFK